MKILFTIQRNKQEQLSSNFRANQQARHQTAQILYIWPTSAAPTRKVFDLVSRLLPSTKGGWPKSGRCHGADSDPGEAHRPNFPNGLVTRWALQGAEFFHRESSVGRPPSLFVPLLARERLWPLPMFLHPWMDSMSKRARAEIAGSLATAPDPSGSGESRRHARIYIL